MQTSKVSALTFEKRNNILAQRLYRYLFVCTYFYFSCCSNGKHVFTDDCYTSIFLYMKLNSYNGDSTVESSRPIIINAE